MRNEKGGGYLFRFRWDFRYFKMIFYFTVTKGWDLVTDGKNNG